MILEVNHGSASGLFSNGWYSAPDFFVFSLSLSLFLTSAAPKNVSWIEVATRPPIRFLVSFVSNEMMVLYSDAFLTVTRNSPEISQR
ncbi:hypothetical protein LZ32DRAFT_185729 [Colletotrichum eremochloae]|nr:hypothetical protein LZ32DRAFT_185729 [Colletotrichum eremochloae]